MKYLIIQSASSIDVTQWTSMGQENWPWKFLERLIPQGRDEMPPVECPGCWGDVSERGLTAEGSQQWHAECLHRGHSIDETVDSQPAYSLFFDNTNILVHCLTLWHTLLYPPLTPINPETHHWSPPHINILSCYPLFSFLTLIFGHFFLSLENFFVFIPTRSILPTWRFFWDPAPPLSMVWPEALDNM